MSAKIPKSSFIQAPSNTRSQKTAGKIINGLIAPFKFAAHNIRIAFKGSTSVKVDLATKKIFKVEASADRVKPGLLRRITHGVVGLISLFPLLNIIPYAIAKKISSNGPKNLEDSKKADNGLNSPQQPKELALGNSEQKNPTLDVKKLSIDELLEKCTGMPLQQDRLLLDTNDSAYKITEDQKKINGELLTRASKMNEEELKSLFNKAKSSPEKFALIAATIAESAPCVVSKTCELFEQIEWPSEELKSKLLPEFMSAAILIKAIAWDNWESGFIQTAPSTNSMSAPGFNCHRILINTKNLFGRGDFTKSPRPISLYLAQSIGLAIKQAAKDAIRELKKLHESDCITNKTLIGVEVCVSQFMETRFPASMIAPLLPHLKNIPGLVSLELSDVGVRNPSDAPLASNENGFKDDHAAELLEIFKTNPHLQNVRINVEGMSELGRDQFVKDWTAIWQAPERFGQPAVESLITYVKS